MHCGIYFLLLILLCFTDALPSSMTCNIGMLSDFFSCNNNDPRDFFLEDYHSIMIEQIKNQFDNFGKDLRL